MHNPENRLKPFDRTARLLPSFRLLHHEYSALRFARYSLFQSPVIGIFIFLLLWDQSEAKPDSIIQPTEPVALMVSCPPDVTIECGSSTLPANTGSPMVTDPCDPTPTIDYYDYTITPPAAGSEMRWVILPPGSNSGSCSSGTNCQTGTICIGLEYTPDVTGTLTSYTTGFFVNCFNGNNPTLSNASCRMTDHSGIINDCSGSGLLLMNCSGNGGTILVHKQVPIILHQVCLLLGSGGSILFDEDEATDLTTSVDVPGGGEISEFPAYTNYALAYDDYCSDPCHYPLTIYRKFVVTDDCNDLATCVQYIDIRDLTPPDITCPPDITLLYPANTNPSNTGSATVTDLCDTAPGLSYVDSLPAQSCPLVNFIKRKWMAIDVCGNQSSCVQWITIQDHGTVCGVVHDDLGQPIGGVQIQLIADINNNLMQDGGDTLISSTLTNVMTGSYCFTNVGPCNYVVVEIQPVTYENLSDTDATPDPDGNDSADGPDNQIPVTVSPLENDLNNDFVDIACPSVVPSIPFDTICGGQSVTLQINDLNLGALTYSWNFGSGSTPGTGTGLGPHNVSYVTTTQNQSSGASVVLTISKTGCSDLTNQVTLIDINPKPNAAINTSAGSICYYTNKVFQPQAPQIPGATYNWNFGSGAVPATMTGYGPHTVYYNSIGAKTVKLVIYPNEAGAQCPDSSTVSFTVTYCPSQVLGYVLSNTGQGIPNVTIKILPDFNHDGIADSVAYRTVTTNVNGLYAIASVLPRNYVIQETQPSGWLTLDDYDASNDGDLATNISGTDNLIPATLLPSEVDSMNNFIETPQPGTITGSVFVDDNGDMLPNPGEGLTGVTIKLFTDNNVNGVADNNTPVAVQTTNSNGDYIFSSIAIGSYVLTETNPSGYFSIKDYDPTNDGDVVPNTNMNNDTIPVTMTNNESDANNYFLDALICPLIVSNTNDAGYASLRYIIDCANPGDTIRFHASLAGQTILLTTQHIDLAKNLVFISTLTPRVTIASSTIGLFNVLNNVTVEFKDLNLKSGNVVGQEGAVFDNMGQIKLHNVIVSKNPSFPTVERLIRNTPGSTINLTGTCQFFY